ncbi:sensor histidine kinase [Slackia isoflavoniconvertens]|uniref:sensor histidine kinase n=1 Tax=Slackia isoflavoniconvertens TaxID=572010 RepID=UPI003A970949
MKHNIASGGIFGGVLEKGAAPQNRSATDWGIDVAVALVAFAFGCAQMVITASSVVHVDAGPYGSSWVNYVPNIYAYLAVALTTAPLILRREAPWFVLALTLACYVFLSNSMGGTVSLSPIGPIVAVYTVASERARGEALAAAAVVGVCAAVVPMGASSVAMALVMRIENVAFVVVAALGGFGVRMYHAYMEETRRRLAEAERTREELAARRVADERVRIAREVHDITAHSLSAVTIQAAAAERLIDLNPAAAKEAIADIRSVSKSSLDEIRSLIGVLRGDEAAEHAPAEGTERMGDVVSFLQRAGIEVDFDESDYDKAQVPAFVDMALFSLARESATNAVRHAHAAHICIELASSPSKAVLVFSDDGVGMGSGVRERAEGHGLEGMGERIEALNGTFTIESEPGRGCTIRAEVPLEVVHDDEHR